MYLLGQLTREIYAKPFGVTSTGRFFVIKSNTTHIKMQTLINCT